MNQESPFEKLDKLYRMLLAPTTFLILISWHYTVYLTNVGMEYPQYTLYTIDPSTALFAAPVMAMVELTALSISLFIYLLLFFEKESKLVWVGKFFCFFTLIVTLFLTPSPILVAVTAAFLGFSGVPSGEAAIPFIIIISVLITFWLFWRANKSGNNS